MACANLLTVDSESSVKLKAMKALTFIVPTARQFDEGKCGNKRGRILVARRRGSLTFITLKSTDITSSAMVRYYHISGSSRSIIDSDSNYSPGSVLSVCGKFRSRSNKNSASTST